MNADELKHRTKQYSLAILNLVELLPFSSSSKVVSYQIAKSGTSVGANYRAVCRARSDREFISKMEIVLEESDETLYWLEIIAEKQWVDKAVVDSVWREGNELTAIFVSSLKTVKARATSKV
jgi:four helix bundle protein